MFIVSVKGAFKNQFLFCGLMHFLVDKEYDKADSGHKSKDKECDQDFVPCTTPGIAPGAASSRFTRFVHSFRSRF
jgi:hypothetical protein